MHKFVFLLFVFFTLSKSLIAQYIPFPKSAKTSHVYSVGKYSQNDFYDTLETHTPFLNKWLAQQNTLFEDYYKTAKNYFIKDELKEITHFENADFIQDRKYFYQVLFDLNGQSIFKSSDIYGKEPDKIVDNDEMISAKGKFGTIRNFKVSKNSEFIAYSFSINGSENLSIRVNNIESGKKLKDTVNKVVDDNITWQGKGFYYTRWNRIDSLNKSEKDYGIYYHHLGTAQSTDTLIFYKKSNDYTYDHFGSSEENYIVIKAFNLKTKTSTFYYKKKTDRNVYPIIVNCDKQIEFIDCNENNFYFTTYLKENQNTLIAVNLNKVDKWTLAIPNFTERLDKVKILKNHIIASYKYGPINFIRTFCNDNNKVLSCSFPLGFDVTSIEGEFESNELFIKLESFYIPSMTLTYNVAKNTLQPTTSTKITYDYTQFIVESKNVLSKDGVSIPILVSYSKNLKQKISPTLLEAYGGYGISNENHFNPEIVSLILHGGIYVKAYVRGGGELGDAWHKGGSGINKSNCYNDFISCAKHLIDSGYTDNKHLAIMGGSHGGLVVCTAMTQSPELFKAIVATAAPTDIAKLLKEENSQYSYNEYGDINKPQELDSVVKYNPYSNIKQEINYPSLFIRASKNDERVPLGNSIKFIAAIQDRPTQINPVILQYNKNSGHFGNENTYDGYVKERIEMLKFIFNELEMK